LLIIPGRVCSTRTRNDPDLVIAGLDPAIHLTELTLLFSMDARVKPAHDD
jgi:hypothetical protein